MVWCENRKSRNLSVSLSHVSVELFMRLRLVSVIGEFLWFGEWLVDQDVQCFPGGHCYPLGVLVQSSRSQYCLKAISIWLVIEKHVPHWDLLLGWAPIWG